MTRGRDAGSAASTPAWYRLLLQLYPRAFRVRFGASMAQAYRDKSQAAAARGSRASAGLAVRTAADVLCTAALLHLERLRDRFLWPQPAAPSHFSGRTSMPFESLRRDVRYGYRMFARNPLFTAMALLALTLGIGANTAIFTIVKSVLLKPLPYADPGELVMVWSTNTAEGRERDTVAPRDFLDYRQATSFSGLHAAYGFLVAAAFTTSSGTEQAIVTALTPGMFEMLGRAPAMGRPFTADEIPTAVVVSHSFWQTRLGGDPNVLGRVVQIQYQPRTIVGVMPADFVFPYRNMLGPSGFTRASHVDAWLPLEFTEANTRATGTATLSRSARFLVTIGRLKPGVTVEQAGAEMAGIARQLAEAFPDTNRVVGTTVRAVHDEAVGSIRPALLLLLAGVGFVLLMACVNLVNLLLARSSARQKEMAIRAALGAGRMRLVRQSLAETTVLSLAGGLLALLCVRWGMQALLAQAPPEIPRIEEVRADATVMLFTFVLSLATGLFIGFVPAVLGSRPAAPSAMRESARGATAGRGQRRLRSGLVILEVALAVVLTIGAGLLLRSFAALVAVDPGFRSDNLLTLQMTVPPRYQAVDQRQTLYADLIERLEGLAGVTHVGGTTRLPLGSTNVTTTIVVEGRNVPTAERPEVEFRRAIHDYFPAMGIPVTRGRGFEPADGPGAPSVAVVNQAMARRIFPGEDPIGRRIQFGTADGPWTTIVGVIGDIRHSALDALPAPEVYINYRQNPPVNPFIVLRTSVDPSALIPAVREQLRAIDQDIAAYDIRPMSAVRSESVAQRRFVMLLSGAFGLLALVMAAVGVYGVMSLVVAERTPEIGIRLALGAQPAQVLAVIIGQGLWLATVGVAIGLAGALLLTPYLATQLFGVGVLDPPTLTGVPVVLLGVALAACYVPARRAMRISPIEALRID